MGELGLRSSQCWAAHSHVRYIVHLQRLSHSRWQLPWTIIMAGGRRKGCLTCRKRKIKCDERRPRCLHCETSSRECVGWASEIEFVAQKQESIPISTGRPSHLSYRLKGFRFKDPACTFEKRKRCSNQATGVVIPDTSSASLKD